MSTEDGVTIFSNKDRIIVHITNPFGASYDARMNWIQVFDYASGLFAGAFTDLKDGGCGIYLFKLDTKTGKFIPMFSLLDNEGDAKLIRNHLGI